MWLVQTCIHLYDLDVGVQDEQAAADQWAMRVAQIVSKPVDYDKAEHYAAINVLEAVSHIARHVVQPMIDLHKAALAGETVQDRDKALEKTVASLPIYERTAAVSHTLRLIDVDPDIHYMSRWSETPLALDRVSRLDTPTEDDYDRLYNEARTLSREWLVDSLEQAVEVA